MGMVKTGVKKMPTEYITHSSKSEWLADRAKDVTSTETAALFGMSPYSTEVELFARKLTGDVVEIKDNPRMMAGRCLEPGIANMASEVLGCEVSPFKVYARDPDLRIGSSFDYEIASGEHKGWILEIKNVDFSIYRDEWTENEAPDHIEIQVAHQLELTQRPGAVIAVLVAGNDLRFITRERNARMGAGIRARIAQFWADVAANRAPEIDFSDPKTADFVIKRNRGSGESVIEADDQVAALLRDYKQAKRAEESFAKVAKSKKAEALELIGKDVGKVLCGNLTLACRDIADVPAKTIMITEDMVGNPYETYAGRSGYRNFKVTEKKS
jgi:putative phage-type endonuclease